MEQATDRLARVSKVCLHFVLCCVQTFSEQTSRSTSSSSKLVFRLKLSFIGKCSFSAVGLLCFHGFPGEFLYKLVRLNYVVNKLNKVDFLLTPKYCIYQELWYLFMVSYDQLYLNSIINQGHTEVFRCEIKLYVRVGAEHSSYCAEQLYQQVCGCLISVYIPKTGHIKLILWQYGSIESQPSAQNSI